MLRLSFSSVVLGAALLVHTTALAESYRLPWPSGIIMHLTQDCDDTRFDDHVGDRKFAWDFANGSSFPVLAARGGTVTHLKMSSSAGCDNPSCVDLANYIVIDHGDATASIYLHLKPGSLDDAVRCGGTVQQGQRLADAGSTGWSTGTHLHFQVNASVSSGAASCECGDDGARCARNVAAWEQFWSSRERPSLPVAFEEWAEAPACEDRTMTLPASSNRSETMLRADAGLPPLPVKEPSAAVSHSGGHREQASVPQQGRVVAFGGVGRGQQPVAIKNRVRARKKAKELRLPRDLGSAGR